MSILSDTITTARLQIVPFSQEHLTARYVGWLNDPVVVRYSEQRQRAHTLDSCRAYWQSFAGTPHCFWAILAACEGSCRSQDAGDGQNSASCRAGAPDLQSGQSACSLDGSGYRHIGNINAYIDPANGVADLGILIGERAVWEQGYGTEAWTAVCRHLLCDRGLRKITAGTLSVNRGMRNIMRRAGMVEDGRRVRQCLFEGEEADVVYTALFRDTIGPALTAGSLPAFRVKGGED